MTVLTLYDSIFPFFHFLKAKYALFLYKFRRRINITIYTYFAFHPISLRWKKVFFFLRAS